MKALYIKIRDDLYKKFKLELVKREKFANEVITELIEKWVKEGDNNGLHRKD